MVAFGVDRSAELGSGLGPRIPLIHAMNGFADSLTQALEPMAEVFRGMNMPEPIVHWGHPLMMAIVAFVLGSAVAIAGWKGRLATDPSVAAANRAQHRKLAPLMALFLAMGYSGGLLSLVMQEQEILASPHFWTGSLVLLLLGVNGLISLTKFGGGRPVLRLTHAYVGTGIMALLLVHGALGLKLGLSI